MLGVRVCACLNPLEGEVAELDERQTYASLEALETEYQREQFLRLQQQQQQQQASTATTVTAHVSTSHSNATESHTEQQVHTRKDTHAYTSVCTVHSSLNCVHVTRTSTSPVLCTCMFASLEQTKEVIQREFGAIGRRGG